MAMGRIGTRLAEAPRPASSRGGGVGTANVGALPSSVSAAPLRREPTEALGSGELRPARGPRALPSNEFAPPNCVPPAMCPAAATELAVPKSAPSVVLPVRTRAIGRLSLPSAVPGAAFSAPPPMLASTVPPPLSAVAAVSGTRRRTVGARTVGVGRRGTAAPLVPDSVAVAHDAGGATVGRR